MKIAIMQPYFAPYLGYFRLLHQTDLFVVYDDVQHIRRGWVHRNQLPVNGEMQWLTLPLKKCPQETLIKDLQFVPDAREQFAGRLKPFGPMPIDLTIDGTPVEYLMRTLRDLCRLLDIKWNVVRSSELEIAPAVRGQERILQICRQLSADTYLNAPGGRDLYDAETFERSGIKLEFLPEWDGPKQSILQTLNDGRVLPERATTLAEQYRRDGYVVLRGAVKPPQCADLILHSRWDVDGLRAAARLMAKRAEIQEMFLAPKIRGAMRELGIAEPIMQTNAVCHAMGFDETFDGTHPHQDFPALQSSLNAAVVWIPIHDVDRDNFPLEMAPGSHRMGLLPAKAGQHYSEVDSAGLEFVPVEMKRGDALLFSVFTVHRTRFPGTGKRVAFSHRYEDAADPWFCANGYPSAQRRVIERELKAVPTIDQVREIFG